MGTRLDGDDIDVGTLVTRVSENPDGVYPLHDAWQQLICGNWSAVTAVCEDAACYLVVGEPSSRRGPVPEHQLRVLERMLHGDGQKILAMDMGLACSTIAATAKQALAAIGLECLPSRVPLSLVLVARASLDHGRTICGNMHTFIHDRRTHHIIALSRPDRWLSTVLPPAEVEVMKARIEGQSHQRIARVRRTSQRTIANQLASASRRLGVSGRLEIIGHLSTVAPLH